MDAIQVTEYFLDDIDRLIVKHLAENGRVSNREIARKLNLNEGTIRARIKRLEADDIVRVTAVVNLARVENSILAFMWADVSPGCCVSTVSKDIAEVPGVFLVWPLIGRADILAMTFVKDANALSDFVQNEVSQVPGVARVRYSFARKIVKHDYYFTSMI